MVGLDYVYTVYNWNNEDKNYHRWRVRRDIKYWEHCEILWALSWTERMAQASRWHVSQQWSGRWPSFKKDALSYLVGWQEKESASAPNWEVRDIEYYNTIWLYNNFTDMNNWITWSKRRFDEISDQLYPRSLWRLLWDWWHSAWGSLREWPHHIPRVPLVKVGRPRMCLQLSCVYCFEVFVKYLNLIRYY